MALLSGFSVAGAEGSEPSVLGFEVAVQRRKMPFQAFCCGVLIIPSAFDALLIQLKAKLPHYRFSLVLSFFVAHLKY